MIEYLVFWLKEYKEGKVSKNTYRIHERNIKNHISPFFQDIKLENVTYKLYQKFINSLIKQEYSIRTIEIIHGTMYGAMQKAKIHKKILSISCEDVTIYSTKEKREKKHKMSTVKFIPYEKIGEFLDEALKDNYSYYLLFRFLIETGTRKGEALALQWNNIDLVNNRVRIVQTIDYEAKTKEDLFGDVKTYHSEREIPITSRLSDELQNHRSRQNDNKFRYKNQYKHDLNLIFCREDGSPLPKSTLFNAFRRILKRADLPELSIHSLRHTHAVLMLESKVEMKFIQEALGHSSMKITSDVYSHVSKTIETDAINRFEKHTQNIFSKGAEMGQKNYL
ncbi:tyrosine-type recombinase/integrase [Brevibacillus laterosporus]|uniref:tyrosine-type recombinase/integrase n=2 Tax=Brevibacillus TaxID=55080 RepID=UPI0037C1342E